MTSLFFFVLAFACSTSKPGGDTSSAETETTLRPVGTPSDHACPAMESTNTGSFSSGGEERTVTMVVPDSPTEGMPLIFFFHGLLDPGSTPRPTAYLASALGLQQRANDLGVVFALPQSGVLSRLGIQFFMWDVEDGESADVQLFDDIRSCASTNLGVDMARVHAVGNSGGGLFTTMVVRERSDALASMVEISGGSDIDMLTFESPLSAYETPEVAVPSLVISGGENDEWPGGGLTLVDFEAASDALADQLAADGNYVVRCHHSLGHSIPMAAITAVELWTQSHVFNHTSTVQEAGVESFEELSDWCAEHS